MIARERICARQRFGNGENFARIKRTTSDFALGENHASIPRTRLRDIARIHPGARAGTARPIKEGRENFVRVN